MKNQIKVDKETQEDMLSEIKAYFLKEREEELGDLGARLLLDFFMEKLAPYAYNQGVFDSYKYMSDRTEDLLGIQK